VLQEVPLLLGVDHFFIIKAQRQPQPLQERDQINCVDEEGAFGIEFCPAFAQVVHVFILEELVFFLVHLLEALQHDRHKQVQEYYSNEEGEGDQVVPSDRRAALVSLPSLLIEIVGELILALIHDVVRGSQVFQHVVPAFPSGNPDQRQERPPKGLEVGSVVQEGPQLDP